jgi:hypothetical protein
MIMFFLYKLVKYNCIRALLISGLY